MERALKKWIYAVRKENFEKKRLFEANKVENIDDAFQLMGTYQMPVKKKSKARV